MKKLIAISLVNIASKNIGNILKKKYNFQAKGKIEGLAFYTSNDLTLVECPEYVLDIDLERFKPELLVIASTHKSEAGIPTLTCHTPGNWSSADLGGQPQTLAIAPALYLRQTLLELRRLKEERNLNYEVSLEVTHHGPTPNIPVMFAEVGSSERQWRDKKACEAVAETIYKVLTEPVEKKPVAVGFGGTHYAPGFTKRVLEGKFAVGHICPKYQADNLNEKIILQAFERTTPKADFAAIEWKGLVKRQRDAIIEILKKHNIKWEKY